MHVVIILLYNYSFSWLACGDGLVNCLCLCCVRARPCVCVCVHSQNTDRFGSTLRLAFYLAILTSLASLPRVNLAIISAVIFWRCVRSMPGVSKCVCGGLCALLTWSFISVPVLIPVQGYQSDDLWVEYKFIHSNVLWYIKYILYIYRLTVCTHSMTICKKSGMSITNYRVCLIICLKWHLLLARSWFLLSISSLKIEIFSLELRSDR